MKTGGVGFELPRLQSLSARFCFCTCGCYDASESKTSQVEWMTRQMVLFSLDWGTRSHGKEPEPKWLSVGCGPAPCLKPMSSRDLPEWRRLPANQQSHCFQLCLFPSRAHWLVCLKSTSNMWASLALGFPSANYIWKMWYWLLTETVACCGLSKVSHNFSLSIFLKSQKHPFPQ